MILTRRIAAGPVDSLLIRKFPPPGGDGNFRAQWVGPAGGQLRTAKPTADPKPLIEAAFRRGLRLGLSIRSASRACPTLARLCEQEARHGP
jgi:hypothetical protein